MRRGGPDALLAVPDFHWILTMRVVRIEDRLFVRIAGHTVQMRRMTWDAQEQPAAEQHANYHGDGLQS